MQPVPVCRMHAACLKYSIFGTCFYFNLAFFVLFCFFYTQRWASYRDALPVVLLSTLHMRPGFLSYCYACLGWVPSSSLASYPLQKSSQRPAPLGTTIRANSKSSPTTRCSVTKRSPTSLTLSSPITTKMAMAMLSTSSSSGSRSNNEASTSRNSDNTSNNSSNITSRRVGVGGGRAISREQCLSGFTSTFWKSRAIHLFVCLFIYFLFYSAWAARHCAAEYGGGDIY